MEFPQYRKYKNNQSYFVIQSFERFTEYKKIGSTWEKTEFKASILPDRVLIEDMMIVPSPYWDELSFNDFNHFINSL